MGVSIATPSRIFLIAVVGFIRLHKLLIQFGFEFERGGFRNERFRLSLFSLLLQLERLKGVFFDQVRVPHKRSDAGFRMLQFCDDFLFFLTLACLSFEEIFVSVAEQTREQVLTLAATIVTIIVIFITAAELIVFA